eukprot:15316_1
MVESLSTVCRCFGYIDDTRQIPLRIKKLARVQRCKNSESTIPHIELEENQQSLLASYTRHNWVRDKDSSIVIIGAGQSGIHMASILKRHGFNNITIMEKNGSYGGKCLSIKDNTNDQHITHELGSCYIHSNYDAFFELLGLYDDSNNELIPIQNEQCEIQIDGQSEQFTKFKVSDWTLNNDRMSVMVAAQQYIELHHEIFGDYMDLSGLNLSTQYPPKPKTMARIDMTFLAFITKHGLDALIPYFVYRNSMLEGYGHLNEMPAFYGLLWNNPRSMRVLVDHKLQKRENLWMLKKGVQHLFEGIIDAEDIRIAYNAEITSINRYLNEQKHKICLMYVDHEVQSEKLIECDVLFCASNMASLVPIISDITEEERHVFDCIHAHTLCTTWFECDVDEKDNALRFYPNNLLKKDGHLFKIRNSTQCLKKKGNETPKMKERNTFIGYQMANDDPNHVDVAFEELLVQDLHDIGMDNVNILRQNVMRYCPLWSQKKINDGIPWLVKDELQGKYKNMYYIGSSVSFQSIESMLEYNIELQHKFHL